jgi:SAM-dependent methyltransferase
MTKLQRFYPESQFGGYSDIDGTVVFFSRVHSLLEPSSVVLDVGCGRGAYGEDRVPFRRNLRILRGKAAKVIGIDVDNGSRGNPFIDEFRLIGGDSWPVDEHSIDVIVCDQVLEHVTEPDVFFSEARRVLKNSGYLCIRTPNKRSYIGVASRLVPGRWHSRVTGFVQDGRKEEDVFPTFYRCNTVGQVRRLLTRSGFQCVVYGYEAEPSYLSFSTAAYFLGVMHQRLAPRSLRAAIFAFGRLIKPDSGHPPSARA